MKLKILFLYCSIIFLIPSIGVSQSSHSTKSKLKSSINWGVKYKNANDEYIRDIIYDDGINIYAVVNTYKGKFVTPSLVKFDDKMTPVKRKEYFGDEGDVYLHGTFYLNGKFVIVTSKFDSQSKSKEFYAQKFNTNLELEGKNTLLWSIPGKKGDDLDMSVNISEDSSKFYIAVLTEQQDITSKQKYFFKIFDSDFNGLFEKKVEFDMRIMQIKIKDFLVSNKADFFVLTRSYNSSGLKDEVRSDNGKVPGYKFILTRYTKDGSVKKIELNYKNKFLNSVLINSERNGDINIFFTYEDSYNDGIVGSNFMKLEANSVELKTINDYTFSKELSEKIGNIQNDKPSKKSNSLSNFFTVTDLHTVEDGSTYVILEKNYQYDRDIWSEGMIVFKINSTGEVKWCDYIPKCQIFGMAGTYWEYHTTFYLKNDLYIFYNDDPDNDQFDIATTNKRPKVLHNIKDISFVEIRFDEAGNVSRNVISNSKEMETAINTRLTKQLSPSRMVLCGLTMNGFGGNSQTKLGILKFDSK